MSWTPQEKGIQAITQLLLDTKSSNSQTQAKVYQQLEHYNKNLQDFNSYLAYIFAYSKSLDASIRQAAGLMLKNNITDNEERVSAQSPIMLYIQKALLDALADSNLNVRHTAGSAVSSIIRNFHLTSWPGLLPTLVKLLETNDVNAVDGAMNALLKICEDHARELTSEELNKPANHIIPKIVPYLQYPNEDVRRNALLAVLQFIPLMPSGLTASMNKFMEGLAVLMKEGSKRIKKYVCRTFVSLLDKPEYLRQNIKFIFEFMILCTQDKDENLALEACEFWNKIGDNDVCKDLLQPLEAYHPQLVKILLNGMMYSEYERSLLEEEAARVDRDTDIAPHIAKGRMHSFGNEDEEEEPLEEEEEEALDEELEGEWNLRKCSASSLDILSSTYGNKMLPHLLPAIQERIQQNQPWEVRESAILAIGAIAEGCQEGMSQYLPGLVPYLAQILDDKQPFVRSITCWTLCRYAKWIVKQPEEKYFKPVLVGLIKRILDPHKKVQEAACSAFATLEENAKHMLVPYLVPILENLGKAFKIYQKKNLLILYDAFGTLADVVGSALNNTNVINMLMTPLIEKWNSLQDTDSGILPLLECLTSVAVALKVGFQPYAKPVFGRCLKLIENTYMQEEIARQTDGDFPDKGFILCSLDLLSAITDALGSSVESLVAESHLLKFLVACMKDEENDVKQLAIGLVGDLAKTCIGRLRPVLNEYMTIILTNVDNSSVSVSNNSCWAIGEIAFNLGSDFKAFAPACIQKIVPLINNQQLSASLIENATIAIGRIGLVCPDIIAPHINVFCQNFCVAAKGVKHDTEKEHAFRGLCAMIRLNPKGVFSSFAYVCDAIASYTEARPEVKHEFANILNGYKQSLGSNWSQYFVQFPTALQQALVKQYNL